MIRIENLLENYSDFRTLYRRHKHQDIQDALNYYQDNKNIRPNDLKNKFPIFSKMDCDVLIDCFQKEQK
jgi:hypothetical protein